MAYEIRLPTTQAANAAYAKPKSKRSARDWQLIVDHESEAVQAILLAELEEVHQRYKKLLDEALPLIVDRSAAAELVRRAEAISQRQRKVASNPRRRTKDLRGGSNGKKDERPPSFYREKYLAYARQYGKVRGFISEQAKEWGVDRGTFAKYMKNDLTADAWQRFEQQLSEAAANQRSMSRRSK